MRLTDEQVMQYNKSFAHHNVLTELKYCGWNIPNRKSISNADIHFYAWLCRSAVALLKEQEAIKPIYNEEKYGDHLPRCGRCEKVLPNNAMYGKVNFCHYCGHAVKWNE